MALIAENAASLLTSEETSLFAVCEATQLAGSSCPRQFSPSQPGEVLMEEFLEPMGITQHKLAATIKMLPRRINEIVHGKRRISADTALRLGRYFGMTAQFWINLQSHHGLEVELDTIGDQLDEITPIQAA